MINFGSFFFFLSVTVLCLAVVICCAIYFGLRFDFKGHKLNINPEKVKQKEKAPSDIYDDLKSDVKLLQETVDDIRDKADS